MSARTRIQVIITVTETGSTDLGAPTDRVVFAYDETLEGGTGDNQADRVWSDTRSVTASSPEDLDLVGGGLTSGLGTAFGPVEVKVLAVRNKGTAGKLLVGGDGTAPAYSGLFGAANDVIKVGESTTEANGLFLWVSPKDGSGLQLAAGTADILQVDASAGTNSYDILAIGASS